MKGRKTGGRIAGTPNKLSRARLDAFKDTKKKIEKALGRGAFEGDAHALMVAVYKDQSLPIQLRLTAARDAAPYEKNRLSTMTHQGPGGVPLIPAASGRSVVDEVRELIEEEMNAEKKKGTHQVPARSAS